ncbi:hypothetical protein FRC01_012420, partial [Tulasnella sp. 417]
TLPESMNPDEGVDGVSTSKSIKELGMKYASIEDTLRDTLRRFEDLEAEGK